MTRVDVIRPGMFGTQAAADARRGEFDISNETWMTRKTPVDFVFIGDSITQNWDIHAYFGNQGRVVVNRGISGDISSHVLRRFSADVIQLRPKHVVVLIGINNFWALDAWEEAGRTPPADIIDAVTKDVTGMVNLALDAQVVPVLCSVLPTDMVFSGFDHLRNNAVVQLNQNLRELAGRTNSIFVDFHREMVSADGNCLREGLADDGLHPHMLGYDVMAAVLRDTLAEHSVKI